MATRRFAPLTIRPEIMCSRNIKSGIGCAVNGMFVEKVVEKVENIRYKCTFVRNILVSAFDTHIGHTADISHLFVNVDTRGYIFNQPWTLDKIVGIQRVVSNRVCYQHSQLRQQRCNVLRNAQFADRGFYLEYELPYLAMSWGIGMIDGKSL